MADCSFLFVHFCVRHVFFLYVVRCSFKLFPCALFLCLIVLCLSFVLFQSDGDYKCGSHSCLEMICNLKEKWCPACNKEYFYEVFCLLKGMSLQTILFLGGCIKSMVYVIFITIYWM